MLVGLLAHWRIHVSWLLPSRQEMNFITQRVQLRHDDLLLFVVVGGGEGDGGRTNTQCFCTFSL
jgi:hypothetical protein